MKSKYVVYCTEEHINKVVFQWYCVYNSAFNKKEDGKSTSMSSKNLRESLNVDITVKVEGVNDKIEYIYLWVDTFKKI